MFVLSNWLLTTHNDVSYDSQLSRGSARFLK